MLCPEDKRARVWFPYARHPPSPCLLTCVQMCRQNASIQCSWGASGEVVCVCSGPHACLGVCVCADLCRCMARMLSCTRVCVPCVSRCGVCDYVCVNGCACVDCTHLWHVHICGHMQVCDVHTHVLCLCVHVWHGLLCTCACVNACMWCACV